jgi:hypothetical protein
VRNVVAVIGDVRAEQLGVTELLSLLLGQHTARLTVRGEVEQAEERQEDRHLQQDRQARGERVGPGLLVQSHRLLGETLAVMAVLLLQLLDLRLEQLHVPAGLDLLHEQRDQCSADHQGEADDRQRPRPARLRTEDAPEERVEPGEDERGDPVERRHDEAADSAEEVEHSGS